ncbi:copper resistance protein B [Haloferula sp. A504]|uniref:copper resistance protein B n=1 Tax=Haloferula sp. A504 TaxID=3373601 RepID=UPI0031BC9450|nr:copper resistance protein B [Verrucomicrobiaceae bacterium E54]
MQSIPEARRAFPALLALLCLLATLPPAGAEMPTTADRPSHQESAQLYSDAPPPPLPEAPPLPEGMSLNEVLDRAAGLPPEDFPDSVPDERIYAFTLFDLFEYRLPDHGGPGRFGWEAQGWIGGDIHKFWWKHEGEAVFEGQDRAESETDLLYSRLITPFWNLQAGVQYANEWSSSNYGDRWSAALGIQGLSPYKFEVDATLYLSEHGNLTADLEAEYDIRLTQRLVLQPRAELGLSAQDIPRRSLGTGLTDAVLDLRLRYEIKREFAPYIGARYRFLIGETRDIAKSAGQRTDEWLLLTGLRFSF